MATGATIHTANGLRVRVTARAAPAQRPAPPAAGQAAEAPALAAAGRTLREGLAPCLTSIRTLAAGDVRAGL